MGDDTTEKKNGCGLLNVVFGKRWPRRATSTGSLPGLKEASIDNNNNLVKQSSNPAQKRRKNSADLEEGNNKTGEVAASEAPETRSFSKSSLNQQNKNQQKQPQQQPEQQIRKPEKHIQQQNGYNHNMQGYVQQGRRVNREATGISGELESMITDHQKSKSNGNGNASLVRASSSNVMLAGNLGNLRQNNGTNNPNAAAASIYDQFFEPSSSSSNSKYPNSVMGNVVKNERNVVSSNKASSVQDPSLCRALSTRMDPEQLKMMGNEDYKNGNFAEALALYDAAIGIDPNKASYRSNKSAALTALGRLLEAVFECREAIRIDPNYHRAQHRLANLYLRLGEVEKAIYHFKHAGQEADQYDIAKCRTIQGHLNKCTDVKRLRDWNSLIKHTAAAISDGADSAPLIYALQAEALLKLHRHQDAEEAMKNASSFSVDDCTKLFGPIGNATLLVVRAQVHLASGRFDDALAAIEKAGKLDPNNREVNNVMRRTKAVATARSRGNELFKAANFLEACIAYGEGLDLDPYNSLLLCNRAACRSKLGHHEKAVEDCSSALNVRPNYTKARLRRADCYFKLEKWEASMQDYEFLLRESPEDDQLIKSLEECQSKLRTKHGG